MKFTEHFEKLQSGQYGKLLQCDVDRTGFGMLRRLARDCRNFPDSPTVLKHPLFQTDTLIAEFERVGDTEFATQIREWCKFPQLALDCRAVNEWDKILLLTDDRFKTTHIDNIMQLLDSLGALSRKSSLCNESIFTAMRLTHYFHRRDCHYADRYYLEQCVAGSITDEVSRLASGFSWHGAEDVAARLRMLYTEYKL